MNVIICYILIYLVEACIFGNYCSNIFVKKRATSFTIFSISVGYLLLFGISFVECFWINLLSFLIVNIFLLLLLYDMKWYSAILHASIITIAMSSTELGILSIITHYEPDFYSNIGYFRNLSVLALFSKLAYFLIMYIISKIVKDQKKHTEPIDHGSIILIIIPIITIFISITLFSLCLNDNLLLIHDYMISICAFLILSINIMIFFYYDYSQRMRKKYTELQLQLLHDESTSEYYHLLQEHDEQQKILIHDIKNHLTLISTFASNGNTENIINYIGEIIETGALKPSPAVCDNELLNAIIAHYKMLFEKKNIKLNVDIRKNTVNTLSEHEITALFSNLLSNAYDSCSKYDDSYTDLSVCQKEDSTLIIISMINTCRTKPLFSKSGHLISSKKDNKNHGFGLKSIENVLNNHNGNIQTYYDKNEGLFHTIILFQ